MANTFNLNLEEILTTDKIKTEFVNKINSNQEKIDEAYGQLVENLLEVTGADNLKDAIDIFVRDKTKYDLAGKCYKSNVPPTSEDGENGDFWIVEGE